MTQELLDVNPQVISSQSLRMGHKANPIKVRSLTSKEFEDDVVDSSLIVGSVAEAILKMAYWPLPSDLPTPTQFQSASSHKTVFLKDVKPPGYDKETWNCHISLDFPKSQKTTLR